MKKIITLVLFIFLASTALSQSNKSEAIDIYCSFIDSEIMQDADIHTAYMVHSISFETNKRAIGKQYTKVDFYYPMPLDSVYETENETKFLYIYKPPVKVYVEYNIAASQNNKISYYFDDSGRLVYYSSISEGAYGFESEQYYFEKDELIKYVIKTPEGTKGREDNFTRHDLFLSGNIYKKAKEYKEMFDELVKLEEIDK